MKKTTTAERLANHLKLDLAGKSINDCREVLDKYFLDGSYKLEQTEDNGNAKVNTYKGTWNNPERVFIIKVYYNFMIITDVSVQQTAPSRKMKIFNIS